MRRVLREMGAIEWVIWVAECIPGAALISLTVTIATSILFDISLESDGWLSLATRFLPGFVLGLLVMMALSYFLGSVVLGVLRLFGRGRR